jgi:23S rRNA (adenine-N6)-dimethyltransferase
LQSPRPGRHELGQNFLVHAATIATIIDAVAATEGPIIEIGAGSGALTRPLAQLDRPLTAIEVDRTTAASLRASVRGPVQVATADFLSYRLPTTAHVLVGNLPFHLTTAMLRRILAAPGWTDAVLLVQWEVARRRAAVGGATLMTAQWWPWFTFDLLGRVPASAFRPAPNVDGGLLVVRRREPPLVTGRSAYQQLVRQVFTGPGRGLADTVARTHRGLSRADVERWLRARRLASRTRAKDLGASDWVDLFELHRDAGSPGPDVAHRTGRSRRR